MIRKTDPQTVAPYLIDASNYSGGCASEAVIPENLDELIGFLRANRQPITVSGAGTGVTASRIPSSGIVVSLERFKTIGEIADGSVEVGAAVSLRDLQEFLQDTPYFYPPNPTETLASLGGTLATNASGSRSYKFGVTRDFVLEAQIVLADGRALRLARGAKIDRPLECEGGPPIEFPHTRYESPRCKNAAGYYVRPGMDWLDLFIGSDGTLGIMTGARLKLLPRPADFLSGVLFFDGEEPCWRLAASLREPDRQGISPCSLEYFDSFSLDRLRRKFPNVPGRARAALFFEQDVAERRNYEPALEAWFDYLNAREVLLDDSWFARDARDVRAFHEFRHELPQMLNEENGRLGRIKVGTDMAVADEHFMEMMRFYRNVLSASGIEYVVFGHIGDNHLHVNLLPEEGQVGKAGEVYQTLVDKVLEWNGTVSAEHGIGKLKKKYYRQMVGERALEELKRIKKALDPNLILGIGNTFDI
ncbi:MAG: FAD-binding oxidoreductase [Nitrospinae bacterium]|nr:FAD-binding oxidoreductase [Nitrospinota bacterium]